MWSAGGGGARNCEPSSEAERGHLAPAGQEGRRERGRRRLPVSGIGPRRVGHDGVPAIVGPEQEHGGRGILADGDAGILRRAVRDRRERRARKASRAAALSGRRVTRVRWAAAMAAASGEAQGGAAMVPRYGS